MKFKLLLLAITLSGCALFEERPQVPTAIGPRDKSYAYTFEEVWRATNLVLQPYPLRVSNMDQGVLETDILRGNKMWKPPYNPEAGFNGESYRLVIRVIRGEIEKRTATKVMVTKEISLARDFFSEPKPLPSDGMEEKVLLYRIGRELEIERALARAHKKQQGS